MAESNPQGVNTDASEGLVEKSILWLCASLPEVVAGAPRLTDNELKMLLAEASGDDLGEAVEVVFRRLDLAYVRIKALKAHTPVPFVAVVPGRGVHLVYGFDNGVWLARTVDGTVEMNSWPDKTVFFAAKAMRKQRVYATATAFFKHVFNRETGWLWQAGLAGLIVSVLLLGTSLYSMQVYDRVIATGGIPTLIVLTGGVVIAIIFEFFMKIVKARIIDNAIRNIDYEYATGLFLRLFDVRLDQFPSTVGNLASQVRSFESVRAFNVSLYVYLLTDVPFALFFLAVIFLIGGPYMMIAPFVAFCISMTAGMLLKMKITKHAENETLVGNRRYGHLVQTIQGVEWLKAIGGGWLATRIWNDLSERTIEETIEVKKLSELSQFIAASVQQLGYVGLVATGAWLATSTTEITIGAIIACSILSGRVLGPVNALPNLLVQWGHAKTALESLDKLYSLEMENHGVESPLLPAEVRGDISIRDLEFQYPGQASTLKIDSLDIRPGEKVAIVGAVGAGKSTLIRLIAGMYRPQGGRVLLDGIDVQHIAARKRAELIGYLPQGPRLQAGTLRSNLTMGLTDVPDQEIARVANLTGLQSLIASRSEGLDLQLSEGSAGVSVGQQQLIAFARLLLGKPAVWLLDEPTAPLDETTERLCLEAMLTNIRRNQTVIVVTHKARLLAMVDRVIVLGPTGILADGPKEEIFKPSQNGPSQAESQGGE